MKVLCALLLLVAAVQGKSLLKSEDHVSFRTQQDFHDFISMLSVNMNDYVDKVLKNAREYLIEHGLDPSPLPDVEKSFSATDLIGIVWHGELILTKGWVQDISTVYRSGDVTVEYVNKTALITANLGFVDIVFNYDFSAKIMNLGPTGTIDGRGDQVQVLMVASADLATKKVTLIDFKITNVGDATAHVNGLGSVLDWAANAIIGIALDLFKGPITAEVETIVKKAIEDALANIEIPFP